MPSTGRTGGASTTRTTLNHWLITHDKSSKQEARTDEPKPRNTTTRGTHGRARTSEHHQSVRKTRRSANNRLTVGKSIIRQTRPSWHRCQDTATKVSPSVTERRVVTCRVPHQKVLRAKPALGHMPTRQPGPWKHPRQHGYCHDLQGRRDTIATGKGTMTATLSRRGKMSR
ncbi:hypothetical protein Taro_044286 [Colocasia esculenta]|uniref:Uncharacterized protein n=1 Tax=Colocasia esculenta TaxID=4460 RepID=A0A843X2E1_COLES|nr:hypothetical protein [Colocasia esculenta]